MISSRAVSKRPISTIFPPTSLPFPKTKDFLLVLYEIVIILNHGKANPTPAHLLPLLLLRTRPDRSTLQKHPFDLLLHPPPQIRPNHPRIHTHQPLRLGPNPDPHLVRLPIHRHQTIHPDPRVLGRVFPEHPKTSS